MRRSCRLLLAVSLLGCAHGPPERASTRPALPPGHPPITLPPGHPPIMAGGAGEAGRSGPGHGQRPFPFPLRDGRTGAPLPSGSLLSRLEAARVIYAGEQHTDAAAHDVQLAVLGRLYALGRRVAVGLEMLPRSMQPQLDAYVAGQLDEEGLLRAVRWEETWGYDFGLYRPIFTFCRAHGLRLYALNAERELVRAVRRLGVAGLPPALRAQLPDGYPWPEPAPHRAQLREVFERHPPPETGPGRGARSEVVSPEEGFARFYRAQLVWDETMAESVARILRGPDPPDRLLVLAGRGHVGPYAVPQRAARRGAAPSLTLAPTEERDGPPPTGAAAVDVLVVTAE